MYLATFWLKTNLNVSRYFFSNPFFFISFCSNNIYHDISYISSKFNNAKPPGCPCKCVVIKWGKMMYTNYALHCVHPRLIRAFYTFYKLLINWYIHTYIWVVYRYGRMNLVPVTHDRTRKFVTNIIQVDNIFTVNE